MNAIVLLQTAAALIILPVLIAGAISDIRNRTFPKKYWDYSAKAAGIVTIMLYLYMIAMHDYLTLMVYLAISIGFGGLFYGLGLRGSGGDYRALIYIVIITPMFALTTLAIALLVGIVQVAIARYLGKTAPWAVGICLAYAGSIMCFAFTNSLITFY